LNNQNKDGVMGMECSTHGREAKYFWLKSLKEKDRQEDADVDGA
jgi:hypothetical protein